MQFVCRCPDRLSTPAWWRHRDSGTPKTKKTPIKAGNSADEIWTDRPAKAAQKDTDARWSMKISKGKFDADGKVLPDITITAFGYKSYVSIDVRHGFIRYLLVMDAVAYDGLRLHEGLIDRTNTASSVWADTAYRSAANEAFLARAGRTSQIHRKKLKDRAMPNYHARANAKKSKVRVRVEYVFGHQKGRMSVMVRSIGIKRAEVTILMGNIAYNFGRWRWWHGRSVPA